MDMGKRTTDNENKGQGDMRQRYGGKGKGKGAKQKVTKETRKKDKRPGSEDERQSAMVRGTMGKGQEWRGNRKDKGLESKDTRQGSGGQGQEKGNGKWTRDKAQKTLSGHTGRRERNMGKGQGDRVG